MWKKLTQILNQSDCIRIYGFEKAEVEGETGTSTSAETSLLASAVMSHSARSIAPPNLAIGAPRESDGHFIFKFFTALLQR